MNLMSCVCKLCSFLTRRARVFKWTSNGNPPMKTNLLLKSSRLLRYVVLLAKLSQMSRAGVRRISKGIIHDFQLNSGYSSLGTGRIIQLQYRFILLPSNGHLRQPYLITAGTLVREPSATGIEISRLNTRESLEFLKVIFIMAIGYDVWTFYPLWYWQYTPGAGGLWATLVRFLTIYTQSGTYADVHVVRPVRLTSEYTLSLLNWPWESQKSWLGTNASSSRDFR